ncbi:MAG: ABC transporter ATP-binding protein [Chloroflexi bacterium RBG_13_50_21]|nr:MAG: ABC transporter ATP-binding protein [Chloroflexi bacterium RBG_13_50_21]
MTTVITINQLTRCFKETMAVNQLSLEVHAGEIFGFLGHNGAGKTTTVRLLNGVIDPTSGNMRVLDLDPQVDGPALRARTGVLTETPSLDERLTAWDILSIYADLYGVPKKTVKPRISELLAEFDLADRANEKVGDFSKGMKQRLALSRALLHRPELIFLDEATSGLDPVSAHHVNELIERMARREGCTVFMCTHNLVEAQRLCDRVAILEHGRLVALGTPAELTRQYVRRLDVEIEVAEEQTEIALKVLRSMPQLVLGEPAQPNGALVVTINQRDSIPDVLASMVQNHVRVYRMAPQEVNLEQVYFTLHEEKEGVQ